MKKEGIMRINSYNKFFTEVAKIMSTSVKSVKQLDGRHEVELANHVYLNVYRGVAGSLVIHDHRGITHITSCYDFEDFKTLEELYERLGSDYSESTKKDVYMKVYRMTVNVTNTIYKCNRFSSIDSLRAKLLQTVRNMAKNGIIEWALVEYVKAKLDNCYLVNGLSSSIMAKTYNYKESRSYTKTFYF